MNSEKQTLRSEFEKALKEECGDQYEGSMGAFLNLRCSWAARWMAERCAVECEKPLPYPMVPTIRTFQDKIRQLAKELT